jgi:hypothetical protein
MLDSKIEEKIKEEMIKLTAVGRTDWDTRHILCTVKWIKKIIEGEGGDERVLIPTMYLHNTGYNHVPLGYSHEQCISAKKGHAENGAKIAKDFLPKLNYFTTKEIERIVYLIKNHDIHENVTEDDRQLVLEADGLGAIDWWSCRPSYNKENATIFLKDFQEKDRVPFVKTETGKKLYSELILKAEEYLKRM